MLCRGGDSPARCCTNDSHRLSLKWQPPPTGPVAALSERPVGSNSTAGGHWCTSRSPDVSLRGAKRPWRPEREARGSALGVQSREGTAVPYQPPFRGTRHCRGGACPSRCCTGGKCGPMLKSNGPQVCHCEERSDVAISGRHFQFVQGADKNAPTDCVCSGAQRAPGRK